MGKRKKVPQLPEEDRIVGEEILHAAAAEQAKIEDYSAGAAEKLALETPPPPPNTEVQLRMHESGDTRFSWWHYPEDGEVLVFDAHELSVRELRAYDSRIVSFSSGRILYIVHGGTGENPLAVEVFNRYCLRYSAVPGNRGISRIDFRSEKAVY